MLVKFAHLIVVFYLGYLYFYCYCTLLLSWEHLNFLACFMREYIFWGQLELPAIDSAPCLRFCKLDGTDGIDTTAL